jgi:hypothetical protein
VRDGAGSAGEVKESSMGHRPGKTKWGLGLVLVALAVSVALSGCVLSAAPTTTNTAFRTVNAQVRLTGFNHGPGQTQTLEEYGIFYSTVRQNVVDVDAGGSASVVIGDAATIVSGSGVQAATYRTAYVAEPSEVGTLTTTMKYLTPGATYYYRTYTIGKRDSNGKRYLTLNSVASFTTSNPTLKSLTKSRGTLSAKFAKTRLAYTNTISSSTSSSRITVKPTLSGSAVQMKIGSGSWSYVRSKLVSVSKHHSKILYIKVTAPDGITATYQVTVKRK